MVLPVMAVQVSSYQAVVYHACVNMNAASAKHPRKLNLVMLRSLALERYSKHSLCRYLSRGSVSSSFFRISLQNLTNFAISLRNLWQNLLIGEYITWQDVDDRILRCASINNGKVFLLASWWIWVSRMQGHLYLECQCFELQIYAEIFRASFWFLRCVADW